jgi:hypothetical protein
MSLEPEMRGVRGLFYGTGDATLFEKQCRAVGAFVEMLLSAAADPDRVS